MNQPIFRQLILSSRKNRGLALPIVLCLGVVVTAVAVAMIASSSAERSKATTQKTKNESRSIAEVAISQTQALLDKYRVLAMYDMSDWKNLDLSENPTTKSSLQVQLESDVCGATAQAQRNKLSEIQTFASKYQNNAWMDLPGRQGSYRLVEYNYLYTSGQAQGQQKAWVVVEGKVGEGNSESISRVNVQLPVIRQPDTDPVFNNIPGLWIREGASDDANDSLREGIAFSRSPIEFVRNGSDFNSNVVMSDRCTFTTTEQTGIASYIQSAQIDNRNGYQAKFVAERFPNLPTMPTNLPSGQTNLALTSSQTFPRNTDTATRKTKGGNPVDVYEYIVDRIDLNGSDTITITAGNRVIFYVKGNIGGTGNGGIKHDCTGVTNCVPTNVQIFGYNTANAASPEICLKGNSNLYAFIFAPSYRVGITGNGDFFGNVWARSWGKIQNCGSNNGKIAVNQQGDWAQLYDDQNFKPVLLNIGSATAWAEMARNSALTPPSP